AGGVTAPVPLGFIVLPAAMAITAVAALGIDRTVYAPLRQRGARPVTLLIGSIGVTLMIQGLIRLFFGSSTQSFFTAVPKEIFRIGTEAIGGTRPIVVTEPQLLMFVVTAAAVVAIHLFLSRSRLGKAMRAMADN